MGMRWRLVALALLGWAIAGEGTSEEILEWSYRSSRLPTALSEMTSAFATAPDEDGDIVSAIYLLGGCDNDGGYIRNATSKKDFYCPKLSALTISYDPTFDSFAKRADMPRPRYRHTSVTLQNQIWVIGGRNEKDEIIKEVDVYDPLLDYWTTLGSLPDFLLVSDHASFARGLNLYIVGGYNSVYEAQTHVFSIDVQKSIEGGTIRYNSLSSLKEARASASVVTYGRHAFIAGGFTHANSHCSALKSVEVYDTKYDYWLKADDLSDGRANAALLDYKGKFFALGGETRQDGSGCGRDGEPRSLARRLTSPVNSVEVLNPALGPDGEWETIRGGLPYGTKFKFASASWFPTASIYAFGGVNNGGTPDETCDCLKLSDSVIVYEHRTESPSSLGSSIIQNWMTHVFIGFPIPLFLFVFIWVLLYLRKRRKAQEDIYGDDGGGALGMIRMKPERRRSLAFL